MISGACFFSGAGRETSADIGADDAEFSGNIPQAERRREGKRASFGCMLDITEHHWHLILRIGHITGT